MSIPSISSDSALISLETTVKWTVFSLWISLKRLEKDFLSWASMRPVPLEKFQSPPKKKLKNVKGVPHSWKFLGFKGIDSHIIYKFTLSDESSTALIARISNHDNEGPKNRNLLFECCIFLALSKPMFWSVSTNRKWQHIKGDARAPFLQINAAAVYAHVVFLRDREHSQELLLLLIAGYCLDN